MHPQHDSAELEILRAFHSTKNSENFETSNGIFLGKSPENLEIVEFLKREPFKRKFHFQEFWEESQMEQKFPVRNFRKSRFTCSFSQGKFLKIQTGSLLSFTILYFGFKHFGQLTLSKILLQVVGNANLVVNSSL